MNRMLVGAIELVEMSMGIGKVEPLMMISFARPPYKMAAMAPKGMIVGDCLDKDLLSE